MSDSEVLLLSVDPVDGSISLGEKFESVVELLFGSIGEAIAGSVLDEGLFNLHGDWCFAEMFVTHKSGGFTKGVHSFIF